MPRKKLGSIQWSKDGKSCRIRISKNYHMLDRTYHYITPEQAQAKLAEMAIELGHDMENEWSQLTLSAYYWGTFRSKPSTRGTKRCKNTLDGYDKVMRSTIEPRLGSIPMRQITHAQIRQCVNNAGSPVNTKRCLSAVLRSAYDDGLIDEKPFDRRVPVHRNRREQELPWNRFEVMAALEAAKSEPVDIELYLILGLSGLRKEECLGVRPCDIEQQTTYSVITGERIETVTVTIHGVYTDADGWREGAKNDYSMRTVPILEIGRERVLERLTESRSAFLEGGGTLEEWATTRLINFTASGYYRRWQKWCKRAELRFIPPSMLRHTSDTIMLTAGVDADLSDKMHGRLEHKSTYASYFRPDVALMEDASKRVSDVLRKSVEN